MTEKLKGWTMRPLGNILVDRFKKAVGWGKPLPPDPWPKEMTEAVYESDARPVCHHCFTPQEGSGWFCPNCCAATGPYNNTMPYLPVFSTGEVVRAGVGGHVKRTHFVAGCYIFYSFIEYVFFAPVYWFRLYRNWKRCADLDEPDDEDFQALENP